MRLRPRLRPWMLVSAVWIAPAALATINQVAQRRLHGEPPASAVTDDGAGVDPQLAIPKNHGIEGSRERLRALYGDRASLDVTAGASEGTVATLRVPYRELSLESDVGER